MILTVFRSRVRPEVHEEYAQWPARLSEIARGMPGYVSHRGFVAEDGERVTLVEFSSREALRAWALHPDHVVAKEKGRRDSYLKYRVQVCSFERAYPKV